MHRFFLPDALTQGPVLTLSEREAHHARQVLRVRRGERVLVLDGAGHELVCEIQDVEKRGVLLAVLGKKFVPPPPCEITLAQALVKGKAMEFILQKAVELGVRRVAPVSAARSVAQVEEAGGAAKLEKWKAIAVDAIKQCGSAWLPEILAPQTPGEFLRGGPVSELSLIAALHESARFSGKCFEEFQSRHGRAPRSVCVWIGPEGDFTPEEMHAVVAAGAEPIRLGPLVLRSETAAIYTLAVVNHELQALA